MEDLSQVLSRLGFDYRIDGPAGRWQMVSKLERETDAHRDLKAVMGGDLGEVRNMTGFAELEQVCRSREVELLISVMSASAAVNAGAGGICVAYAGDMVPM